MTQDIYRIHDATPNELNRLFWLISNRLDELEGYRGQGTFRTVPKSDQQATEGDELVRYDQLDILTPSELTLTDTVWDDIRIPVTAVRVGGSKNPTWSSFPNGTSDTGLNALHFSYQVVEGNEEEIYFMAQLPHSYKIGGAVRFHVHWSPETTGTGTVRWGFEYSWADIDAKFGEPVHAFQNVTLTEDQQDVNILTSITDLTDPGIESISSMIVGRLWRNSSHADDTFSDDAVLLEVDFHFELNALGSREEFVK